MKPSFKQKLWQAAPWLWMAAGYLYMLWYHIVPGAWIVDSDLAGEMVLADLLNQEGGILSTNWFYTSELRVFHMQWFYRLGLLVFPHDWHAARVLAMALVMAVLTAAALFFADAAGLGRAGVWCAAALLWPFGRWYLFLCLYGGYYLVYIIFSLLTIGIVLRLRQALPRRKALLYLGFGSLLGLMSGLNGVRQLMVLYVPLLAAVLAAAIWHIHTGHSVSLREAAHAYPEAFRMLGSTVLFTACSGAGYLVNLFFLARSHPFLTYDSMTWTETPKSLLEVWRTFLLLFGYQEERPLFSFAGISSGLGLLLGIAVLGSTIRLGLRFARLELRHQVVAAFTVSALFVCGLVFAFLGPDNPVYWLPVLPFGLAALLLAGQVEAFRLRGARQALVLCFAVCISVCSVSAVQKELEQPTRGQPGLDTVVDWMLDRGYSGGYAYFWTSQAVTELSDGQIEMWTVTYEGDDLYRWLQKRDHDSRLPDTPYFMLFDLYKGERPENFLGGAEVYRDDRYVVQEYTDPAAIPENMARIHALLEN